jgi:hypothetical protein
LQATLKHAASMPNPLFYERQRLRMSTWDTPRFMRSYDETVDGGLVLPRGLTDTVASLVEQAGSRLDITDERASREPREFAFSATLTGPQRERRAHALPIAVEIGRLNQPLTLDATTMRPSTSARPGLPPAAIPSPRQPHDTSPAACDHTATTTARP